MRCRAVFSHGSRETSIPLSRNYGTCMTVKSRPESGIGLDEQVLQTFQVVPCSLGSGSGRGHGAFHTQHGGIRRLCCLDILRAT